MVNDRAKASAQYGDIMSVIADRFKVISQIHHAGKGNFSNSEALAFQLRKIVEGTAFGCLVAIENGLKKIPKDAVGQWNADKIFAALSKRDINVLPNPSVLRAATQAEIKSDNVQFAIEGQPDKCLTISEIRRIYRATHGWLHERNPYVGSNADFLRKNENELWSNGTKVFEMLERHFIGIGGEAFYCVLADINDGLTKVQPFSKLSH
jgi:hypothetical protein